MRKVGIVGGSGYIGSSIASHLKDDFRVRVIDVKPPVELPDNVEYRKCDIRKMGEVKEALKGLDLVIHTAIVQIPRINEDKILGYEVNITGTENVCKVVDESNSVKGLVLSGTWHTIGEMEIAGVIDEAFGYRPDMVEKRARLYALSKIIQEGIVRYYDELSDKIFGIIRMGTVLGERMPPGTAASIFIDRALKGLSITPYKHSMHRPMLYVDVTDVVKAFEIFANKILDDQVTIGNNSIDHIVNVMYPEPVTIFNMAKIVKDSLIELTNGKLCPRIEIVDKGLPCLFSPEDKSKFKIDIEKAIHYLGFNNLVRPKESIQRLIQKKLEIREL